MAQRAGQVARPGRCGLRRFGAGAATRHSAEYLGPLRRAELYRGRSSRLHVLAVRCNWERPARAGSYNAGLFRGGLGNEELAAGVEAYPAPLGQRVAEMSQAWHRRRQGFLPEPGACGGSKGVCGAIQPHPGGWSQETNQPVQAGAADGRHRAQRLGMGGACSRAPKPGGTWPSFSP